MTRLQKKCLIAAAGTHLLLVVILLCSGFTWSHKEKVDDSQVMTAIPEKLIDAALNSGVKNATPPPPTPITPPEPPQPQQQQQPPTPPQPKHVAQPPPEPEKQQEADVKPDDQSPEPLPRPPKKHTIDVNKKLVVKTITPTKDTSEEDAKAEREAQQAAERAERAREARAKAFRNAARSIRNNTSSSTTIDMPGDSTVAYASYASVVKTVYTEAWQPPANADNDEAIVKVKVTIANTGRVISAHIIDRSGDAGLDRSIQSTLDRVTELPPFPEGSSDKERTYTINFNLKAKRMLG